MPAPERIAQVVKEWVTKAENDFAAAEHLANIGDEHAIDAICFHAQQCVEKYLKALLVRENIDFPKTHDLEAIMAMLPSQLRPNLSADEQKALTRCAVAIRYPSELGAKSLNEAEEYLEVARRIRKDLRPLLPASALA